MRYSKILSKLIETAKLSHCNNQITRSNNKIKTTRNVIRSETGGNNIKYGKVNIFNTDKVQNKNVNAEIFDKYFSTIDESISCEITGSNKQIISCVTHSLSYLSQVFNLPFTNIVTHNTFTGGIEKKIIHFFPWKIS
jgi:hypothetical protein